MLRDYRILKRATGLLGVINAGGGVGKEIRRSLHLIKLEQCMLWQYLSGRNIPLRYLSMPLTHSVP